MPTICLDCRYLTARPSGIATMIAALVEHLPHLAPDWRFVFLRHASVPHPLSCAPNVTEQAIAAPANGPGTMWRMSRLAELGGVDLFHAPANILPHGLLMPCVTTVHDLMWLIDPRLCATGWWALVERRFYGNGLRRALRRSDAIIAVSEATRRDVMAFAPSVATRTHTALLGVGRRAGEPDEADAAVLRKLGLVPRHYVLVVGQSAPYKNHDGAMRGFARSFAGRRDMMLVMVQRRGAAGRGGTELAERLGIGEQILFLPAVEQGQLQALYRGALTLLHPSLHEGFGIPLAEAMAAGCPVITSDRSAMSEVVGDAALLVDPCSADSISDALLRISADPELRETLIARGIRRASQLDWRAFAARHLEVYEAVLADVKRPRAAR